MNPGDFRHRVAFEKRADASDKYGGTKAAWAAQFTVAAAIRAKFGSEAVTAARLEGTQPVTITVRRTSKTADVDATWRARDVKSGEIYNIRSKADPDDRRAYIELLCEAGAAT